MRNRMNGGRRPFREAKELEVVFEPNGWVTMEYNPEGDWPVIEVGFSGDEPYVYVEVNGKEITYDLHSGGPYYFDDNGEEIRLDTDDLWDLEGITAKDVKFIESVLNDNYLLKEFDDWQESEVIKRFPYFLEKNDLELYYYNDSSFANTGTYVLVEKGARAPEGTELVTDYTKFTWVITDSYEKRTATESYISLKVIREGDDEYDEDEW
jgi:hypothetical protein